MIRKLLLKNVNSKESGNGKKEEIWKAIRHINMRNEWHDMNIRKICLEFTNKSKPLGKKFTFVFLKRTHQNTQKW